MTKPPTDAVVAGTKNFAVALLAPLTTRVGIRPRIAADAAQALSLCTGTGGLVVIEYLGDASLAGIEQLVRAGSGIRVVAGVPAAHASANAALRALGVETALWDGRPDAVLNAVERLGATAPQPAEPHPAATPAPRPATIAAAAPRPAATAAPRPAATPAPSPRPAATPVPSPRPAAVPAPRPAATPAPRPVGTPAPAPAPAPATAATQPRPLPSVARPAAAHAPLATAAAVPARPAAPPPAMAPAAPSAPPAAAGDSPQAGAFFGDLSAQEGFLGSEPLDLDVDDAMAAISGAPPPMMYVPPPAATAAGDWPSTAPSAADAEVALVHAAAGTADAGGVGVSAVAVQVAAALTELERVVLRGSEAPVDADVIRRAAVMRVRVAAALASAPAPGSPVDEGAVHTLLGDIDALLSAVGGLAQTAPAEVQGALEAIRNGLVKEAIDFSEVAQRVGAAAPAKVEAPRASARAAQARVLSINAGRAAAEPRGSRWMAALLLACALAAGGFHGWRFWQRRSARIAATAGAPEGMTTLAVRPDGSRLLAPAAIDRAVDPAELARFEAAEAAKGNVVQPAGGGMLEVRPRSEPAPANANAQETR
jgi:hypothetical protein